MRKSKSRNISRNYWGIKNEMVKLFKYLIYSHFFISFLCLCSLTTALNISIFYLIFFTNFIFIKTLFYCRFCGVAVGENWQQLVTLKFDQVHTFASQRLVFEGKNELFFLEMHQIWHLSFCMTILTKKKLLLKFFLMPQRELEIFTIFLSIACKPLVLFYQEG